MGVGLGAGNEVYAPPPPWAPLSPSVPLQEGMAPLPPQGVDTLTVRLKEYRVQVLDQDMRSTSEVKVVEVAAENNTDRCVCKCK